MGEREFHKEKTEYQRSQSVPRPQTWIFKLKRSAEYLAQRIKMDPRLGTSDSEGEGDIITVAKDERRSSRKRVHCAWFPAAAPAAEDCGVRTPPHTQRLKRPPLRSQLTPHRRGTRRKEGQKKRKGKGAQEIQGDRCARGLQTPVQTEAKQERDFQHRRN